MTWLLLSIFGASMASALVPLINIEVILGATVTQQSHHAVVLVLVATAGQMLGKILWYWGAVEVERAPWVRRQLEKPKAKATLDRWSARAEGRPWFTAALLFISAATGFPPYAVTAVLAGTLRVNFWTFLATGFLGRGLRFWIVVASVSAVVHHT
ncbi:YqaA family protein [Nocardioides zeicaulis]|uniref:YqaA family protein n=1 Tax=Nocardioides zeicaulis TaxID=1776857 RepID=A0ABV6E5X2_9ACTN